MERSKVKTIIYHVLDWLLYLGLTGFSVFFMVDCIKDFTSRHTFFENSPTKKEFVESPTLTLCFAPSYKQSELESYGLKDMPSPFNTDIELDLTFPYTFDEMVSACSYQIGRDFELHINAGFMNICTTITKTGTSYFNVGSNSSASVEVKPIITNHGLCHKIILNTNSVGYLYMNFFVSMKENVIDLPKMATIFVTSEKNSDGVIDLQWSEGTRSTIEVPFGDQFSHIANLKMEKITYLSKTTGCSTKMTHYECHIEKFAKVDFSEYCPNPCIPFFHQDYGNMKNNSTIPVCKTYQENYCIYEPFVKFMLKNHNSCPSSCEQVSYSLEVTKAPRNLKFSNNSAIWSLIFASKSINEKEQNLAYPMTDFIGFIGGTVGLFNGFSFYGFIEVPLKFLFNV